MTEEESQQLGRTIVGLIATTVLVAAAVDTFGLVKGFGIWAAIWLLSPYAPRSK